MRRVIVLAGFAGLFLAAPAMAQRPRIFGIDPTTITFAPVDTSKSTVPIAMPQDNSKLMNFSLSDLFPTFRLPGGKPVQGTSVFPLPKDMPGPGYLSAFGYQRYSARR